MKTKLTALSLGLCLLLAACGRPQTDGKAIGAEGQFGVADRFTAFYSAHGGLTTLGEAISPEISDGAMNYQYFQNGRLEYNPAAAPGAEISLSALGLEYNEPEPPATPEAESGALCYVETGHCVTAFREYYETYGGVNFFGYPITPMAMDIDAGRAVQHFERASLVWDTSLPAGARIQLAPLGLLKCAEVNCRVPPAAPVPPGVDEHGLPTPTPLGTPFGEFVNRHGGVRVFGDALTLPVPGADGMLEQYYTNAVLVQDLAAPEGVRLRPLGLERRAADPPVAQVSDFDGHYDPITGHNVLFEFREFYDLAGGLLVLGRPLTEITAEDGKAVQYFENTRMEYNGSASAGARISLSPLGREALAAAGGVLPAMPPQVLKVQTWAETPILALGQRQTVRVRVSDERGNPLAGAAVNVLVSTTGAPLEFSLQATGADGQTAMNFLLPEWRPGEMVLFKVSVEHNGIQAEPVIDQFIQWHGPIPTATPAPTD